MGPNRLATLGAALWTGERKTRIRLQQWALTLAIYLGSAGVLACMARWGVLAGTQVAAWLAVVLSGLAVFYAAMRSGWSRRFADPALTQWQIAFGVVCVLWGYSMSGSVRSATLFPMMVILTFGAYSLSWRRMALLTVLALAALAATMVLMHWRQPALDPVVDVANFLLAAVMLPATSVVALFLGSLRAGLRRQRSELTAALEKIHALATSDDLTGLANRRHAQQLLELEAQRHERAGTPLSVALIDLDHFKHINDAHGHAGGDAVLRRFAEEARASVRACDLVARWGGEEFLLLMPGAAADSAQLVTERLRSRIAATPLALPGGPVRFTLSAGVAQHRPGDPVAETLLRADRALYRAKAAGRNRSEPAA